MTPRKKETQVIDNQLLEFYFYLQLLKIEGILKATSKNILLYYLSFSFNNTKWTHSNNRVSPFIETYAKIEMGDIKGKLLSFRQLTESERCLGFDEFLKSR